MAEYLAAEGVIPSDLGSFQHAVRLVLTNDLITADRPRSGSLDVVLRWADRISADMQELFGYTLIATARQVRLVRRNDVLDPTQHLIFTSRSGRQFDRRRLAYLCLVLAGFQRSRIEVSLVDIVKAVTPLANAQPSLGFEPTITEHRRAVVDVLDWLTDRGALRLSDGSLDAWAGGDREGDALYDIDHDVCGVLFRPPAALQHVASAAQLMEGADGPNKNARREAAARRARRLLIEQPVVYFERCEPAVAAALRSADLAENLARLTGLVVERRAEGVMLADPSGRFTDRIFPLKGGAVNRTAGLILGAIANLLEEPDEAQKLPRLPVPTLAEETADLVTRIDSARPLREDDRPARPQAPVTDAELNQPGLNAPFLSTAQVATIVDDLYVEFGASSFTAIWQGDPTGLARAATRFLADLGLVHEIPGGLLVLPAAARYRNIQGVLPQPAPDGLFPLDFTENKDGTDR